MAYTSTIRMPGLYSGLDTESLISTMMKAETMKLNRMQRNLTTLTWKQEQYRSVHTDLSKFQKTFLDLSSATSFRMTTMFKTKATSVKTSAGVDSTAVTVGDGAKDGTYSIKVDQLAQADMYESTSKVGGSITSADKFDVANIRQGTSYEIKLDGATKKISFNEGDVVSGGTLTFVDGAISVKDAAGNVKVLDNKGFVDVLNQKLKSAFGMEGTSTTKQKVEAKILDSGSMSLFTNGYHTGFSIADGGYVSSSAIAGKSAAFTDGAATEAKKLEFDISYNNEKKTISVDASVGMTTAELKDALNQKLKDEGWASKMQFGVDGDGNIKLTGGSLNQEIKIEDGANGKDSLKYLGFTGDSVTLPATSSLSGIGITSGSAAKIGDGSTLSDIFGSGLTSETSFTINGKTFSFDGKTKMSDLIKEVNDAGLGVTMRYDEYNEVFQLESNSTGYANKIDMSGEFLTKNLSFGSTATREAKDSVATINGITLTRATNEYEFEGVKWKLNKTTAGEALTVTVARDVDGIVDSIKNFVNSYNEMIEKLDGLTSTSRPKSNGSTGSYYDPLVDEEKAEMSETQINQWESLAKQGLLHRDSLISGISQQLRSALYETVTLEGGSKIALYELGITTGDWRDGGKLVIDEEKLRKAVSERGEDVMNFFSKGPTDNTDAKTKHATEGLAYRMNDIINNAVSPNGSIASKAGIVGYRSETDNFIYKQMKTESDRISLMYDRLAEKEAYYYKLFARMESSISKGNSQIEYLQSISGGS